MTRTLDEILDAMIKVLIHTKNLPEGFILSKQERIKMINLLDKCLDGPENEKETAEILTVAVLDINAQRGF